MTWQRLYQFSLKSAAAKIISLIILILGVNLAPTHALAISSSIDPEDDFIQTIPGIKAGIFGPSAKQISQALSQDNYRAFCATEEFTADRQLSGDIKLLEELGITKVLNPATKIITEVKETPTERNDKIRDEKAADAQSYIGEDEPNPLYTTDPDITVGSVYRMLPLATQCRYGIKALEHIDKHCGDLSKPENCPMNNPILVNAKTQETMMTLELASNWAGVDPFLCQAYAGVNPNSGETASYLELQTTLTPLQKKLLQGAINTPFYFPEMERIAFLLLVEHKPPRDDGIFNFNTIMHKLSEKDAVQAHSFPLPATFTEQNEDNDSLGIANVTTEALQTHLFNLNTKKLKDEEKEAFKSQVSQASTSGPVINCSLSSCLNQEVQALVKMVNATPLDELDCNHFVDEVETQLTASAKAKLDSDNIYSASTKNAYGTFIDKLNQGLLKFTSKFQIPPGDEPASAEVVVYLIAPQESMKTARATLTELLTSLDYQAEIALIDLPNQLDLISEDSLSSDPDTKKVFEHCDPKSATIGEDEVDCNKSVSATVTASGNSDPGRGGVLAKTHRENLVVPEQGFTRWGDKANLWAKYNGNSQFNASDPSFGTGNFLRGTTTSNLGGSKSLAGNDVCEEAGMTIDLPAFSENNKIIKTIADKVGIKPGTLNGLMQIEGSQVLRAQRAGATSIACGDTINDAGAVGLMQFIQGDCTDRSDLKGIKRDFNPCNFTEALEHAALKYKQDLEYHNGDEALAACSYHFGAEGAKQYGANCAGAPKLGEGSGCDGLNYAECVLEKYGTWD